MIQFLNGKEFAFDWGLCGSLSYLHTTAFLFGKVSYWNSIFK